MNRQEEAIRKPTQACRRTGVSELPSRILRARVSRRIGELLMVTGILASMSVLTVGTICGLCILATAAWALAVARYAASHSNRA